MNSANPRITGSIYIIECLINNYIYVGQTINKPINRWKQHIRRLRKKTHYNEFLQRTFNKYGEQSLNFKVIDNKYTQLELDYSENEWMLFYSKTTKLFNMKDGGNGGNEIVKAASKKISKALKGRKFSKEHKENLSLAKCGPNHPRYGIKGIDNPLFGRTLTREHKDKLSKALSGKNNPNYGKHISDEQKQKISIAQKRRKHYPPSKETRLKLSLAHSGSKNAMYGTKAYNRIEVISIDENNKQIKFETLTEAAKYHNVSLSVVYNICNNKKTNPIRGMLFKYAKPKNHKS